LFFNITKSVFTEKTALRISTGQHEMHRRKKEIARRSSFFCAFVAGVQILESVRATSLGLPERRFCLRIQTAGQQLGGLRHVETLGRCP